MTGRFQVGFSRSDITPMQGIRMRGYYRERICEGVLDALEINAIAVQYGESTAILMSFDMCCFDNSVASAIKEEISRVTGISEEAIYLAATHSHTGPFLDNHSEYPLEQEYFRFVLHRSVDAAKTALSDLKPAKMGCAVAKAPEGIAFIRRYRMKDGSVRTNPGVNNPDIDHPIGELDLRVNVLKFERDGGDSILLVNFGNHPDVISGCRISADWPGFLRRTLERTLPGNRCIFFTGAQGDVNHLNVFPKEGELAATGPKGGAERYLYSRFIGEALAGSVLQVYSKILTTDIHSVQFAQKTICVPSNMPDPKDVPEARRIYDLYVSGRITDSRDPGNPEDLPYDGMERVTVLAEAKRIALLANGPEYFEMPLSAVAIDDVLFIGIPGEAFTGIGVALKKMEGWKLVLPTVLTNGSFGYFPMKDAFDEGGYEARGSRFRAGVAEQIIREGMELAASLKKIEE